MRQGDVPGVQIGARAHLGAPPEVVWRWLTEPAKMAEWLTSGELPESRSPGVLHLQATDESGLPISERVETLEIEARRRWTLAWRRIDQDWPVATRLTFELESHGERCDLTLLHEGFAHLPLSECLTIWEFYRRRWRMALERLERALGSLGSG